MNRRCPTCGTSYPPDTAFCGNDGSLTIQEQERTDFDPRLGEVIDGYKVVARVADGATGRVYEGRDPETREKVAIKVLHPNVSKDPVAVERFKRECETVGALSHPNVVRILGAGETIDGSHYMTMEFLEGEELGTLLRREGAQPPARGLRMVCQLSLALEHAHSFGIIHRDLKPDNVFLCRSPEGDVVKVLDFGSVKLQMEFGPKLTAFGTTLGSPYYMAPEQALGKGDIDRRADVFALAAIFYEMLTGRVAFEGHSVGEILMKIVQGSPAPLDAIGLGLPVEIEEVLEGGLAKDKAHRYGSTLAFAQAVCRTFGLTDDVERWGQTPQNTLAASIRTHEPRPSEKPRAEPMVVRTGPGGSAGRISLPPLSAPSYSRKPTLPIPLLVAGVSLAVVFALILVVLLHS